MFTLMNDDKYTPLVALYSFYDEFIRDFSFACQKGCSTCCTVNVAVTTLEADMVARAVGHGLDEDMEKDLVAAATSARYIPTTTLNRNTWQIIRGEEITEDKGEHGEGKCPLLDSNGLCLVYDSRPFACRAMSSVTPCLEHGAADMDPFLITINLSMYQIIEHLDSHGGFTGNLSGLLHASVCKPDSATESGEVEESNRENVNTMVEVRNCPLPGFIVPPGDKLRFKSFLRRLLAWPAGDGTLSRYLPEEIPVY